MIDLVVTGALSLACQLAADANIDPFRRRFRAVCQGGAVVACEFESIVYELADRRIAVACKPKPDPIFKDGFES